MLAPATQVALLHDAEEYNEMTAQDVYMSRLRLLHQAECGALLFTDLFAALNASWDSFHAHANEAMKTVRKGQGSLRGLLLQSAFQVSHQPA